MIGNVKTEHSRFCNMHVIKYHHLHLPALPALHYGPISQYTHFYPWKAFWEPLLIEDCVLWQVLSHWCQVQAAFNDMGKKEKKKKTAPMWRKQSRVKTYPLLLWVIHFNSAVCVWSWNHDKVNEALKATGTPYSPVKRSPVKTVGFFFCLQIRCCTTEVLFPLRGKFSLYSYFLISSIAAKYMSAAKTPRLPN